MTKHSEDQFFCINAFIFQNPVNGNNVAGISQSKMSLLFWCNTLTSAFFNFFVNRSLKRKTNATAVFNGCLVFILFTNDCHKHWQKHKIVVLWIINQQKWFITSLIALELMFAVMPNFDVIIHHPPYVK